MSNYTLAQILFDTNGNPIGSIQPDGYNRLQVQTELSSSGVKLTDGTNPIGTNSNPIRIDPVGNTVQPVSATSLPLPSGAATESTLETLVTTSDFNTRLNTLGQKSSANSAPVVLSSDQTAIPVTDNGGSLTIDASSLPLPTGAATESTLSGVLTTTDFNARVNTLGQKVSSGSTPVVLASDQTSIPITDNGGSLTIDGYVGLTQAGNVATISALGALKVDNSGVTQPISGTITANLGTTTTDRVTTSTLVMTNTTNSVILAVPGTGSATIQFTGAWTGTVSFEGTTDTNNWTALRVLVPVTGQVVTTTTGNAQFIIPAAGYTQIRARCSTVGTGTATVIINASSGSQLTSVINPLPAGGNQIGTIGQAGTWTVQPGNTANTTPWLTKISDGTNTAVIKASGIVPLTTDPALVVSISPNSSLTTNADGYVSASSPTYTNSTFQPLSLTNAGALRIDGSAATQPISGTVTANAGTGTFAVSGTVTANQGGTWTVQPGNTANTTPWLNTISQGGNAAIVTASNALKVDNSGVTQPISGIVTANAGSGTFTVAGVVTSNIGTTNGLALDSTVSKLTIAQNAALGTNTQLLNGGSVTTSAPTYTTGNINPFSLNTSGGLRVDGSGVTQPISGSITANAGTGNFTVVQATASNLNATVTGTVGSTQSGIWTIQPGNTANTTPWLLTISQGGNAATVTAGNALKIDGSAVTQPISGTITANIGTSGSLALDATLTGGTQRSKITDGTNNAAIKAASTAAVSTDPALVVAISPNNILPITGTVTANAGTGNFNIVQSTASSLNATVIGTTAAGSGASSGLITIQGNASGTPVPVSGSITATNPSVSTTTITPPTAATYIGGSVTTAVPSYTNATMNALSLNASGGLRVDGSAATQPISLSNVNTGILAALNANIQITLGGATVVGYYVSASLIGTLKGQYSYDGTNWVDGFIQTTSNGSSTSQLINNAIQNGTLYVQPGAAYARLVCSAYTSGSSTATITANNSTGIFRIGDGSFGSGGAAAVKGGGAGVSGSDAALVVTVSPTTPIKIYDGSNTASVSSAGALKIDGSAVTQPVSGTVTAIQSTAASLRSQTASEATTATTVGTVASLTGGSVTTTAPTYTTGQMNSLSLTTVGALRVDGSAVTQPVSGTVTANAGSGTFTVSGTVTSNIGTTNGLALDATISKLTVAQSSALGTNTQALIGGSVTTAAPTYTTGNINPLSLTTSGALRTDSSATTQPISGTVTANAGTGNFTVVQSTASNLNATVSGTVSSVQSGTWTVQPGNTANTTPWLSTISQGGNAAMVTASNALKIDGSAITQPVSGSITANIGTSGSLALDATLTGGTQRSKITDGTNNASVKAASTAAIATDPALVVAISPNNIVTVTGTVTANNPSVSTTAATPPSSATYIAGSVTTAAPSYTTGQLNPLSLTTSGALRVDGSLVTQPVTGTVTANAGTGNFTVVQATASNLNANVSGTVAATQSGTYTVQPGNTANTTPWLSTINQGGNSAIVTVGNALKIDGSAVTQPVSGTIIVTQATGSNLNAVVSGAVTANIGTTNGIALDSTVSKLTIAQSAALGANTQSLIGGSVTTAAPIYTTGNINPLSLTTSGSLRVDASSTTQPISGIVTANAGSGNFTVVQSTASNLNATVTGTVATTQSGTWTVQPGNTANTTPWLSTISQGGNSATVTVSNALKVDGSGVTQPVSGTVTANAGTGTFAVSGTVTSNIGTTNGLALDATISKLTIAQGAALGSNTQALTGGSVTTSAPTYTTGQISPLSLTTTGSLRVDPGTVKLSDSLSVGLIATASGSVPTSSSAALIVSLSPNSTSHTNAGTLSALNSTLLLTNIPLMKNAGIELITSSFTGSLVIESSANASYASSYFIDPAVGNPVQQLNFTSDSNIYVYYVIIPPGSLTTRVRVTAYTSGSVIINTNTNYSDFDLNLYTTATGQISPPRGVFVGGSVSTSAPSYSNGTFNSLSLTTSGALRIDGSATTQPISILNAFTTAALNILNANVVSILSGNTGAMMTLAAGTLIGTIVAEVSSDNSNYVQTYFIDPTTGVTSLSIVFSSSNTLTIKSIYTPVGTFTCRVRVSAFTSGTATCSINATTANNPGLINNGGIVTTSSPTYTSGTNQPLSLDTTGALRTTNKVTDTIGQAQYNFPAGFVRVTDEPRQVFYDPFDTSLDTTNRWVSPTSSGGGVAASVTTGILTVGSGTTASGYSYLQSQPAFVPTVPSWLGVSFAIALETPIGNNAHRFWGSGTTPSTPTTSAPITDGFGFEIDTAGKLYAVVYASGTRTVIQDLSSSGNNSQPTDANYHRYIIYYRTDRIFWYIDSLATPVATSNFQGPNVQTLPVKISAIASSSAPAASRVISCAGLAVWDTGKNNVQISDGTYQWRKATIKAGSTAAAATDSSIVVALSPNNSISGNVTTSPPSYTNATTQPLSLDTNGNLRISNENTVSTGTLGALNAAVSVSTNGSNSVGFYLVAGTLVGTVVPEVSLDNGTTWVSTVFFDGSSSLAVSSQAAVSNLPLLGGVTNVRVRVSAYTSGSSAAWVNGTNVDRTIQALVDNNPFYDNSTRVMPTGQIFDEVSGTALTENDIATSRIDSKRAQVMVIEDSTTRGQRTAVSAAGSLKIEGAGASGGPAGGVLTVQTADNRFAGTFTGLNQSWTVNMSGSLGAGFGLAAGTLIGTAVAEVSYDGTNFVLTGMRDPVTGLVSQSLVFTSANTLVNRSIIIPAGVNQARVRMSAYTSGSCTINIAATQSQDVLPTNVSSTNAVVPYTTALMGGQSGGVMRNMKLSHYGNPKVGFDTLLLSDAIEGTTVNSFIWTQSTATMTIAQTTGVMTLNNAGTLTTTTDAIITSNKQMSLVNHGVLKISFRAMITPGSTNAFIELGLGAPTATTAIISNGAFFRLNGTALSCVTSFNGSENVIAETPTLVSGRYYMFYLYVNEDDTKFIIEDSAGIPILDTAVSIPLTTPYIAAATHLPVFARVYNSAAVATAAKLQISCVDAMSLDYNSSKPWSDQLAGTGRSANISPTTYAQTLQCAAAAAPTAVTPTTLSCSYTTLGGEYVINATATSEAYLGLFGYTIPSPYSFYITDILIVPPIVTTTMGATITIQHYALMVASSAVPGSATGQRYPLGYYSVAASAAPPTIFNGSVLNPQFRTPIVVNPGQVLMILYKCISGIATGASRGTIVINGYYE